MVIILIISIAVFMGRENFKILVTNSQQILNLQYMIILSLYFYGYIAKHSSVQFLLILAFMNGSYIYRPINFLNTISTSILYCDMHGTQVRLNYIYTFNNSNNVELVANNNNGNYY